VTSYKVVITKLQLVVLQLFNEFPAFYAARSSIVLSHFSPQPFKPKQTFILDMHMFNKHPVRQELERTFEIQRKKKFCSVKDKGKGHPRTGHGSPEGEQRYSSALSVTLALDRGGWSKPSPGRFTPGRETRYPWYRRLGGPKGRSGRVRKISPPLDSISGPSSP
jgi:hypothetical protein